MNILPLFVVTQEVIVDRIEEDFAVVEWNNKSLSLIPLDDFYTRPTEGDRYRFRLAKNPSGTCFLIKNDPVVLQCKERTLIAPIRIRWSEHRTLDWDLYPTSNSVQQPLHTNTSHFWHSL